MPLETLVRKSFSFLSFLAIFFSLAFFPYRVFGQVESLSPAVSEVSNTFSDKFCVQISQGVSLPLAGKAAAKQMFSSLVFSPVVKEIIATPKEDLVESLATNIYDRCSDNLDASKQEITAYLEELADTGSRESKFTQQQSPLRQFGMS